MNLANLALTIVSQNTTASPYALLEDEDFKTKLVNHIKGNSELEDITLDLIDYVNANY